MSTFTHVLDTSAWIAHLQREPGWEIVSQLLGDSESAVGISTLSLVELHARMRSTVPVDELIALRTVAIRQEAAGRVPTVDAMIAATASVQNAILVHRDPHFAAVPAGLLEQLPLPTD